MEIRPRPQLAQPTGRCGADARHGPCSLCPHLLTHSPRPRQSAVTTGHGIVTLHNQPGQQGGCSITTPLTMNSSLTPPKCHQLSCSESILGAKATGGENCTAVVTHAGPLAEASLQRVASLSNPLRYLPLDPVQFSWWQQEEADSGLGQMALASTDPLLCQPQGAP